jgi:hypothetical protein
MKLTLIAVAAATCLFAGCQTPGLEDNHWHVSSVGPDIAYYFFGYNETMDGSYGNRFGMDMSSIGLTFRRHVLNDNPYNPLEPEPAHAPYRPEPPNVEFEIANKQ